MFILVQEYFYCRQ